MGGMPKQDRMLGDAPLLVQTLRALLASACVERVVVAVDGDRVAEYELTLSTYLSDRLFTVVSGSASRQASVSEMVDVFQDVACHVVLVHDAARPFVTPDLIDRLVSSAFETGAASPAVAVADTLRRGEGDVFGETVDRDDVYRIQTPQAFRPDVLRLAHARADPNMPATDDAGLAARAGHTVARVEGSVFNFKITTPDDWTLATALWPLWSSGALQTN